MLRVSIRSVGLALLAVTTISIPAAGEPFLIITTLSPSLYSVEAGRQITLSGFFTPSGTLPFRYDEEFLFGLQPTSPHLGIASGSVLSSRDFDPPIGGASFEDLFSADGYLGPRTVQGPRSSPVAPLRTLLIPANTAPGTYRYSYGVLFLAPGFVGQQLFDTSLRIVVTPTAVPEPPTLLLLALGVIGGTCWRRSRGRA
jgi:hypothetical protein